MLFMYRNSWCFDLQWERHTHPEPPIHRCGGRKAQENRWGQHRLTALPVPPLRNLQPTWRVQKLSKLQKETNFVEKRNEGSKHISLYIPRLFLDVGDDIDGEDNNLQCAMRKSRGCVIKKRPLHWISDDNLFWRMTCWSGQNQRQPRRRTRRCRTRAKDCGGWGIASAKDCPIVTPLRTFGTTDSRWEWDSCRVFIFIGQSPHNDNW